MTALLAISTILALVIGISRMRNGARRQRLTGASIAFLAILVTTCYMFLTSSTLIAVGEAACQALGRHYDERAIYPSLLFDVSGTRAFDCNGGQRVFMELQPY